MSPAFVKFESLKSNVPVTSRLPAILTSPAKVASLLLSNLKTSETVVPLVVLNTKADAFSLAVNVSSATASILAPRDTVPLVSSAPKNSIIPSL